MLEKQFVSRWTAVKGVVMFMMFLCFVYSSQAQVRKNQRVKIIDKGTYNLHGTDEQMTQKKDKDFYIVYSDQSNNTAFNDAYAQKRGEPQPFLRPYFVLNEENDYFELAAYDPTLIGKPKGMTAMFHSGKYSFSDAKQAEYVGWIHKNRLLHYSQAESSSLNFRPVRYVLGINKVKTLFNIERFVEGDQVKLYSDPTLKNRLDKSMLLNQIAYVYKENQRNTAVLVSNKSQISMADTAERIMGWVPKELLTYVGQHQVFGIEDTDSIIFYQDDYYSEAEILRRHEIGSPLIFNTEKNDNTSALKRDTTQVMVPTNVWDHRFNTLTNVEGDELLISKINEIKEQSKNINFHFIFDSGKEAKLKQIKLMSSLQRIWLLYAENEDYADYNFTFSTSSYGSNEFYIFEKTTSFPQWIEYINKVLLNDTTVHKTMVNDVGIERCFNFALAGSDSIDFSTNILLVSGMKAFARMSPNTKKNVARRLAQASSRLIFFQLVNNSEDVYQEYILQAKDLLSRVALQYGDFIRSFSVDNQLVKSKNIFAPIPAQDNLYVYDAPEFSNYQGGIGFSKVNSELTPTSFDMVLDTVLYNTLEANRLYTESLERYNSKLGFLRSRPSDYIAKSVDQDSVYQEMVNLIPRNNLNERYNQYKELIIRRNKLTPAYLLSEPELQILIDNYKSLIPLFSGDVSKKQRNMVLKIFEQNVKNLNSVFLNRILSGRKSMAELIFIKTGIPVGMAELHDLKVKDISKKRKMGHDEFGQMLRTLRAKIDELEVIYTKDINMTEEFDASTKYYFVPVENLF